MTLPDRPRIAAWLCCLAVLVCAAWAVPAAAPGQVRDKKLRKDYALIIGTVWDKQERAVYGAKVSIRRAGDKKPRWELMSDHSGEFAQRVPPGKSDYIVRLEDTRYVVDSAVPKRKFKPGEVEVKVHIEEDERADVSLHLNQ